MKKHFFIISIALTLGIIVLSCSNNTKGNPTQENTETVKQTLPTDTLSDAKTAENNTADGKSVLDYFFAIPLQYVMPEKIDGEFSEEYKKSMIVEKDIANGYLKVKGIDDMSWAGYSEVVLWKRKSGKDLVGILISYSASEESSQMLVFWEQNGNDWRDVTEKVYRAISVEEADKIYTKKIGANTRNAMTGNTEITLKLPKKGLNIEVYFDNNENGEQVKVAEHKWDGERFNLSY